MDTHDLRNAEGYCNKCGQPLDITGTCYVCIMNSPQMKALSDPQTRMLKVIEAAQRVLDAVEFDEDRAMMYIRMPGTDYGFDMSEKIKNPLAEAILPPIVYLTL